MKHLLIAGVATLGLVSAAAAQTSTTTTTTTSGGTAVTTGSVTIQPEVRTKVRQFVTTKKPKSVMAPSGFTVTRGAVLPESIEVETFPSDVGISDYRYTVVGDRTVLVDNSRRIVEVIE